MKYLIIILLLASPLLTYSNSSDITKIRQLFLQASHEKIETEVFLSFLKQYQEVKSPTIAGYKAMAFMLMSKDCWNPYTKYDYFLKGKTLLEKAIGNDENNLELRYLRLCIQKSLPSILNYNSEISEDQQYLLNNWNSLQDNELKIAIRTYLLDNNLIFQ